MSTGEREDYHDALKEIERLRAEIERWRDSNCRLRDGMESQAKRANEAEWVILAVRDLCTTDHESKEAFIARVKSSLPNNQASHAPHE